MAESFEKLQELVKENSRCVKNIEEEKGLLFRFLCVQDVFLFFDDISARPSKLRFSLKCRDYGRPPCSMHDLSSSLLSIMFVAVNPHNFFSLPPLSVIYFAKSPLFYFSCWLFSQKKKISSLFCGCPYIVSSPPWVSWIVKPSRVFSFNTRIYIDISRVSCPYLFTISIREDILISLIICDNVKSISSFVP